MSNTNWEVEGRSFQYKKDYLEALEDKKKILKIKEQFNLHDYNSLKSLIIEIEKKTFQFHTLVGEDFIDEVYQKYDEIRSNNTSSKKSKNATHKKKSNSKSKVKKKIKRQRHLKLFQLKILMKICKRI